MARPVGVIMVEPPAARPLRKAAVATVATGVVDAV
jgi:hypothetical protein